MPANARPTPIIVLTGFLGSGKSTLLGALLRDPAFANVGVIINEYGDVAVDHDLVTEGRPQVMTTSTGCLCCTAAADIRASMIVIHDAAKAAGRWPLGAVIVETTGLADPAPVVNQLVAGALPAFALRDHTVARHYQLSGVVCTFDVLQGPHTLARHPEAAKQLAFADRILLTKSDLVDPANRAIRVNHVRNTLAGINEQAAVLDVNAPGFDLPAVFAPRPYAPSDLAGSVSDWLGLGAGNGHAGTDDHPPTEHYHLHHHHHHHDDSGIRTVSLVREAMVSKDAMAQALDLVSFLHGPRLLRLKGIVGFEDEPENPYVLQVVQHVVHPLSRLNAWPSADRRTRIVAITHGIDGDDLERLISRAWDAPAEADAAAVAPA